MSGGTADEWYADGLRFSCTQCGHCCTGPPGTVWFTDTEGAAIAESLGIEIAEFYKHYALKVGGRWSLKETLVGEGYDCVFLDRKTGAALCSIYGNRPTQCMGGEDFPSYGRPEGKRWGNVHSPWSLPHLMGNEWAVTRSIFVVLLLRLEPESF